MLREIKENLIRELGDKNILILGFGREGIDTFKFLRKLFPNKIIGIADKAKVISCKSQVSRLIGKDKKNRLHSGKDYLELMKKYDVVIKTPGIPIHLPEVEKAFREGKITSQTEIFLKNCPGTVVGITGTKGKSTTTSLIYNILKVAGPARTRHNFADVGGSDAGGLKAHLVGNIGKPVLSSLFSASKNDFYVYELSCYQLYNVKKSPHISVFLNVFPEHLDYYKNIEEYAISKLNIALWQDKEDFLVFNPQNDYLGKLISKNPIKSRKIDFNSVALGKIIKASEIPLKGEFNLKNVRASIATAKILGISDRNITKGIKTFKPLPHRLEYVGLYEGIKFYNDSLSTISETTMAAIDTFGKDLETIFLGGFDRNLTFESLAQKIIKSNIKNLILFPTTGEKIWQQIVSLNKGNGLQAFFVDNMKDGVSLAYKHTQKRKICLLSTASTSFSIFKDYKEKGNLFKKYVKIFGKKK